MAELNVRPAALGYWCPLCTGYRKVGFFSRPSLEQHLMLFHGEPVRVTEPRRQETPPRFDVG